jgi:vitamin B12 transporter
VVAFVIAGGRPKTDPAGSLATVAAFQGDAVLGIVMHISKALALSAAVSAVTLAVAAPAFAQVLDIGEVVVTPNRTPTEKAKTGSTVETVTEEEIAEQAKPLITDYLTLLPGVYVSPQGTGRETSLSIRGADKKYVKTLYNGIDISDPTVTQVQTSYEHLLAGGVSRIEVLKGSQSTLYGADAVAGVIGISTLGGIEPGVRHEIAVEGGSFGTARGSYRMTGNSGDSRVAVGVHGFTTDGISAADEADGNTEADAYRNATLDFAGETRINDVLSIFASGLLIKSEGDFDDSGPVDNPFNVTDSMQKAARLGFNADLLDGRFKNTVSAQIFDIDRDLVQVSRFGPFEGTYLGQRAKIDYQGSFEATDRVLLQFGADHERQSAHIFNNFGGNMNQSFTIAGLWTQAVVEPVDDLVLTAGLRHDDHSVFGSYTTYRFTGAYTIDAIDAKLHASVGTGFRAPSIFELYDPFAGNSTLRPEESTSFDVGIEKRFLDGALVADVTYFQLDTENLIDYSYVTFNYVQTVGVTRRRGVETSLVWSPTAWLDLGAAYTYTHTRQPDGARRPRVPTHDFAVTATVRPAEKWEVSATAQAVIDVEDRISPSFGTFTDVELDDYVLLNAKVAYKPTENTEFYVRGENLLDQKYQVVKGYGTPGVSVYAGFRGQF